MWFCLLSFFHKQSFHIYASIQAWKIIQKHQDSEKNFQKEIRSIKFPPFIFKHLQFKVYFVCHQLNFQLNVFCFYT